MPDASHVNLQSSRTPAQAPRIHQLPCEIDCDGPANVSTYFVMNNQQEAGSENTELSSSSKNATASFRGRYLVGSTMVIPEGYTGVLFKEGGAVVETDNTDTPRSNRWDAQGKFREFMVWEHDAKPRVGEGVMNVPNWIQFASELHK
ncbi:ribonuclease H2, subunit C [Cladochytrium replicatum]|nr:ribonuclease H2, subunit C [Cladochytrium replicatum]